MGTKGNIQIGDKGTRSSTASGVSSTRDTFGAGRCVHWLIEDQIRKSPDTVAVSFGEELITYRELESRANALAWILTGMGVVPDTFVAVHLDRSIDLVVTLLAILKAGGAYVYLDPDYPARRREFILSDADPAAIVSRRRLVENLPGAMASRTVCIDAEPVLAFRSIGPNRAFAGQAR